MSIQELLSEQRVSLAMPAPTKQRLLESLCGLLRAGGSDIDERRALEAVLARERLGSTGIGEGVALPHGRVPQLKHAIGAFATLERAMDYDSVDRKPVVMAFVLLVPENAAQEHLRILSDLAGLFSNKPWRRTLLEAKTEHELYLRLTRPENAPSTYDAESHHQRPV